MKALSLAIIVVEGEKSEDSMFPVTAVSTTHIHAKRIHH